jgi:hypothetical protein
VADLAADFEGVAFVGLLAAVPEAPAAFADTFLVRSPHEPLKKAPVGGDHTRISDNADYGTGHHRLTLPEYETDRPRCVSGPCTEPRPELSRTGFLMGC